jgi:hypothetical protein
MAQLRSEAVEGGSPELPMGLVVGTRGRKARQEGNVGYRFMSKWMDADYKCG